MTRIKLCYQMGHMEAITEDDMGRFSSCGDPSSCPSLSSSLACKDASSRGASGNRRESFSHSEPSASQDDFSNLSTPITSFSSSDFADAKPSGFDTLYASNETHLPFSLYDCSMDLCSSSDPFWSTSDEMSSTPATLITPPTEQVNHSGSASANPALEYAPSSAAGVDSSISQAIFQDSRWSLDMADHPSLQGWTVVERETTPPQTVIPSAMFQPTFASPSYSTPPVTPKRHHQTEHGLPTILSSPGMFSSPEDEMGYQLVPSVKQETFPSPATSRIRVKKEVMPMPPRLDKRPYACNRRSTGGGRLPKSPAKRRANGRRGYPSIIEKTKHFCRIPGCEGKFKRKEHLKRHEQTAKHEHRVTQMDKETAAFLCAFCGRSLSRSDNLKQHKKMTHGQNKANKRNKYVATCDRESWWFDDEYEGLVGEGGLPTTDVEADKQYLAPREKPEEEARKQRANWMRINPTNLTCSRMKIKLQSRL
ncbi:MAG: hypothetical protein Q9160_002688 [Pyrenula sp. 1 TL-2023]